MANGGPLLTLVHPRYAAGVFRGWPSIGGQPKLARYTRVQYGGEVPARVGTDYCATGGDCQLTSGSPTRTDI